MSRRQKEAVAEQGAGAAPERIPVLVDRNHQPNPRIHILRVRLTELHRFAGDAATPATVTARSTTSKATIFFTFDPLDHGNGQGRFLRHQHRQT